jgi:hypothetical protein
MARIVLGSYMVRYPLGGMMSWVLQWIVGFQRLGHEITFVEKAGYPHSCYDPLRDVMTDDCTYGTAVVKELLSRFDLGERWCYVDVGGAYHGMSRPDIEAVFADADVFVDMGTHGAWLEEAHRSGLRVLVDGEPGFTQMKRANALTRGQPLPVYDLYYTTGQDIGTPASTAPSAGERWRHIFHPVVSELFAGLVPEASAPFSESMPFTTVMNWQSYEPVTYEGTVYDHKDVEFERFLDLPRYSRGVFEVAVSGKTVPRDRLRQAGWSVRDAHDVTISFDSFRDYIGASIGEFSVCKSGYVVTRSGWFSDRSAAYLAAGRPVILQDTGFSRHLPTGIGLFAPTSVEEAADAADRILGDPAGHSRAAVEISRAHLDAGVVLSRFLTEIGL